MFNLKMMRLRRYRIFLLIAAIFTIAIVRMTKQNQWQQASEIVIHEQAADSEDYHAKDAENALAGELTQTIENKMSVDIEDLAHPGGPIQEDVKALVEPTPIVIEQTAVSIPTEASIQDPAGRLPEVDIPDRKPLPKSKAEDADPGLHARPPGPKSDTSALPSSSVHWIKKEEAFPVSELIRLPTGKPKAIPAIQHKFGDESTLAKTTRESRLARVKEEFLHSWRGYKDKAWLHDELMPVSGKSKDPFGGWAATLVDSLDTLWIMGLTSEFAEAVEAVGLIDFTTANRPEIPVFETTIRYLGGLIAAYDVSGAKYPILLQQAKSLGAVLMSIFDTPNRMPILYYQWRPTFSTNKRRASEHANTAELGSLSMEFTRLAQITNDDRYYDAIARITNALYEWQQRGTSLDGLFPSSVDASGCNRTATVELQEARRAAKAAQRKADASMSDTQELRTTDTEDTLGDKASSPPPAKDATKSSIGGNRDDLELEITTSGGGPSKAKLKIVDETDDTVMRRDLGYGDSTADADPTVEDKTGDPVSLERDHTNDITQDAPLTPTDSKDTDSPDWECVPQELAAPRGGHEGYSLGGGQDSTYEYFTKQHLLLGGLEPKYQTLYQKTMAAAKKHLLFRPMISEDRKILFSGKLNVRPDSSSFDSEVTHLTCFLGGMVAMGSKVFDAGSDLEVARRLTDGCVWAYETTKTGVMVEYGQIIACENAEDCPWNETLWRHQLDPVWDRREQMIKDYDAAAEGRRQKELKAAQDKQLKLEQEQTEAANTATKQAAQQGHAATTEPSDARKAGSEELWAEPRGITDEMLTDVDSKSPPSTRGEGVAEPDLEGKADAKPVAKSKRAVIPDAYDDASPLAEVPRGVTHDFREDVQDAKEQARLSGLTSEQRKGLQSDTTSPPIKPADTPSSQGDKLQDKLRSTQEELRLEEGKHSAAEKHSAITPTTTFSSDEEDPNRPLSHDEFITRKIERELIPRGYTFIGDHRYILR